MIEIMLALKAREAERERRVKLSNTFISARKVGVHHCVQCGACCHTRPCVPTPDELHTITAHLGLSLHELTTMYFCVDNYEGTYHLKPAGENQMDLVGRYIPTMRTYNEGKCIFLQEDNTCRIHAVKPRTASETNCWEEGSGADTFQDAMNAWRDVDVASFFPEGHEIWGEE